MSLGKRSSGGAVLSERSGPTVSVGLFLLPPIRDDQNMFGFLAPLTKIPEWRRSYARVCQHQRRLFGLSSLPFLSYEAAFLYQVAVDLGVIQGLPETAPQCCRLRKMRTSDPNADKEVADYAASFGVLLLGVKLRDDAQDSGSLLSRFLKWKYGRQVRRAEDGLRPFGVIDTVKTAIARHEQLERDGERDLPTYVAPTALGFASVFESLPSIAADLRRHLREIGANVGRAIIYWDCAVDFKRDQIRGDYNPLRSEDDVKRAFDHCLIELAQIGWALPAGSASGALVESVMTRVRAFRSKAACDPVVTMERWGFLKQRTSAYARCDGLEVCCMVGEVGECCGAAGEAGGLCAECAAAPGPMICIPDCCCCCPAHLGGTSKSERQQSSHGTTEASVYAWCHGKTGVTEGILNPSGFVSIDGERVPAKTVDGRLLETGSTVRVIRTDPYGVTVEVTA